MKVLFVHDGHLYTDAGGAYYGVHYNNQIVERYLNLGSTVTFATRLKKLSTSQKKNFSLINHPAFGHVEIPDFKSFSKYMAVRPRANKLIDSAVNNHDVIVARMPSASGTMAVEAARKQNKPYLVEMVACTFDGYWNYSWKGKLIAHFKLWQQQRVIKDSPYVIYVTNAFLQNRYPTNGKSISCSNVELKSIDQNDLEKKLLHFKNKLQNKMLVIGTVAALNVQYKGQDDVIKALGLLKLKGVSIKYKLVGQGSSERLESLSKKYDVEKEVEILGSLEHQEVFRFLENIDVYIQPSKQEGLPRALIEAMSKACPALGAKTAGIPELLDSECIFKPSDENEIAEKLQNINQNWLSNQAKRNFETAKAYQKNILEKRRYDFYREFLNNHELI